MLIKMVNTDRSLLFDVGAESFCLKELSITEGNVLERSQISTSFFILSYGKQIREFHSEEKYTADTCQSRRWEYGIISTNDSTSPNTRNIILDHPDPFVYGVPFDPLERTE
jgi:hypothetical protein